MRPVMEIELAAFLPEFVPPFLGRKLGFDLTSLGCERGRTKLLAIRRAAF